MTVKKYKKMEKRVQHSWQDPGPGALSIQKIQKNTKNTKNTKKYKKYKKYKTIQKLQKK